MYYSIVHNSRYCVVLRDGVAEALIMELPTEALADEVVFQLQMAWYDGESWGKDKMKKQLDPDGGYHFKVSNAIKDVKNMSQSERKQHHDEMEEQHRSQQKEVRQQVLRLKR
ncbi:hypothetical protein ASL14_15930 [Paenibacillus sp. IHB B 3084]|uniref:hypothetical protein n=1 Tax=Paenibacillus sp. IHB B 3084 TaxID=867076 RepID=UPI000721F82C|nr:hypothetical protein [Paenibacillus sp. IHB B 3084]ALP37452.1 hypothetical protein ASL14_15930 [Paenibacillus sp. IHB B 3084]